MFAKVENNYIVEPNRLMRLAESGLMQHCWDSSYKRNIDKCSIKELRSLRNEVYG